MEHGSLNRKSSVPERSAGYLVSGYSLALLEQIEKVLDSAQKSKTESQSFLQKSLASLRKEKDNWKSFMEEEEWNKEKVREVEAAWEERFQGDQPNVLPSLEQLAEKTKEPIQKPAPESRPLRRSHTDPTDLLWVFRRRSSLLTQLNNQDRKLPRRKNGFSGPCPRTATDGYYCESIPETNGLSEKTTLQHASRCDSHSSQDSQRKESASEEKARESSSDSEIKDDTPYEWTSMPVKHDETRRKISCPAYRAGRRESVVSVHANQRRASVAVPRRMNRRGSEAPALTVIARRRNSQSLAYPVGFRRKISRANGTDHHLSIQAKAKHEMLANLVLPALVEEFPRTRLERRNTFSFQGTTMRTKKDEKRYQVAKEILDTEKKYLACLRTLKEVFEKPIRQNNLISPKEIDVLFPGELDQILKSHTLFMKDLEERLQNWKLQGIVGDIFTKLSGSYHIDVLRIYSNYVNNFPKAIGVINKASRGSQKFRKYLQNCSSNSECEGLDLPAFLLTPIQRLPRYVLLLRQLSKYTDPGHPDSFHIENALETMKQMINILNDSIQSSCKLASNSHMRRSYRRKTLKKKGKELQRSRQNSQDGDRLSIGTSGISTPSAESFGPGRTCSHDTSPEREAVILEERSGSPTMLHESEGSTRSLDRRSRPGSAGEMEPSCERDIQEEFETIKEEDNENLEDNKSSGQNVFRMAADSLKRNWQRRSKKWRKSTEEPAKRESVDEMETAVKNKDASQDDLEEPTIAQSQDVFEDENGNVDLEVKHSKKSYTPPCSPATKNLRKKAVAFPPKPRPVSLGFPPSFQLRTEQQKALKDKVFSDPSLTKEKSFENCLDVWIPRQNLPLTRRRTSRQSVCSRNSSVFSGDMSPLSGSKKSLSHISQESLADSGVSETPGSSPSSTLTCRTHKRSTQEQREKLSHSLTNVTASGETKRKQSQLNRRSWGDWISAEMENDNDEVTVDREDHVDDGGVKNKRKFKDVMRQLFSPKKKHTSTSPSYLVDKTTNAHCSSKNSPKNAKTEIREKISTV